MKYYITTAIAYVNSRPHIGTAYEHIGADAIARYQRLGGKDVFFMVGNDEHSINVEKRAQQEGLDALVYCDTMEAEFQRIWRKLDVSFDFFIRTSMPKHHLAVQEIFRRIKAKGDIYKGAYKGWYCVGCEAYKDPSELVKERCPNHPNQPPKWIEQENYFFALSKYADRVKKHILDNPNFVRPETRRNELLSFIDQGVKDLSISRFKSTWGVPVPDDPDHVVYVWFDALINYLTATGFPQPSKYWPADLHVIGKDITRFHGVIWPAMLMAADVELPAAIWGHGFVYLEGQKISKSGVNVGPEEIVDKYGSDALRYFLLREVPWDRDGNFEWNKFTERYNRDLGNDLGNLVNRLSNMTHQFLGGVLARPKTTLEHDGSLKETLLGMLPRYRQLMERYEMHTCLAELWERIKRANTYIEQVAPWQLNKQGKRQEIEACLYNIGESLRILAILLSPFIPATAAKIWESLGLLADKPVSAMRLEEAGQWGLLKEGTAVQKIPVLFPRFKE